MIDSLTANYNSNPLFETLKNNPIAFFCAEYALSENLPIYAGGLGILAGDIVREAADQRLPFVAIGLFYHEGFVGQTLNKSGDVVDTLHSVEPEKCGLAPVVDKSNTRIIVEIPIQDRIISLQAWKWQQGSISVYLLDADLPLNSEADKEITGRLYAADKEMRLKQSMTLGIGGVRLLEKLNIHPSVYHMNEGHSSFLALDLIRHEMEKRSVGFNDAKRFTMSHIVFTNHTLVGAGQETFSNDLVSALVSKYSEQLQIPSKEIVALGMIQESSIFSMTMLSLRIASRINAVSKIHQRKAAELWKDHPMIAVTNGIHIPTWDFIGEMDIWNKHQDNKRELLSLIYERTGERWSEDELIIGWSRRMVAYKRPESLFEDIEALKNILQKADHPVKIVISGNPHSGDLNGAEILKRMDNLFKNELSGLAVYLPSYSFGLAKSLISGCDVWLNTPVVGFEACGTSGMKACLNGVLPISTKDGWIDEIELFGIGWALDSDSLNKNLLKVLEQEVVPMFYTDGKYEWKRLMKNARELILSKFSATRMLNEYIDEMYFPTISGLHA